MNISVTQLKQQTHLLDHVKQEDIIITKREKPFPVVIDIERYRALIKEANESKLEHKLAALSQLGSFSLGGKDFRDLKSEMGNG